MLRSVVQKKGWHPFAGIRRQVLAENLAVLQRQLAATERSLLLVIDGWECAGKGYLLNQVLRELDPRYYEVTLYEAPSDDERRQLSLQRYFTKVPARGQMMVFDRSQYWELLHDPEMDEARLAALVEDVRFFERVLAADGTAVVKCFLHQPQALMAKRVAAERQRLAKDERSLKVRTTLDQADALQLADYPRCLAHFERVLTLTNTPVPWHVIQATHHKDMAREVLGLLNEAIIDLLLAEPPASTPLVKIEKDALTPPLMPKEPKHYSRELERLQKEAGALMHRCYLLGIPVVIAFEGTDAAGKGGTIRRLTRYMDPRGYDVATTAAPSAYESERHYLWRFFRVMPRLGHLTIFDRTWYGRVLVERVEDLTPRARWQAAYQEINAMEAALQRHGVVLMKFLLVISKEEQKRRFTARAETPEKRYKLTDEDWRNHGKFEAYETAMHEMVARTSEVPWQVVNSENKKAARLAVLETVVNTLQAAIAKREGEAMLPDSLRQRMTWTLY